MSSNSAECSGGMVERLSHLFDPLDHPGQKEYYRVTFTLYKRDGWLQADATFVLRFRGAAKR